MARSNLANHSLGWRLWHLLRNPPASSHLYTRTYYESDSAWARTLQIGVGGLFVATVLLGGVPLVLVLAPLVGPVIGGVFAYGISGTLRRRFTAHLALLGVTPNGKLGGLLFVALGVMHRKGRFNDLTGPQLGAVMLVGAGVVTLPLLWWLVLDAVEEIGGVWFVGLFFACVTLNRLLASVANRYCVLSGVLFGTLAATFRLSVIAVQVGATLAYVGLFALVVLALSALTGLCYGLALRLTSATWALLLTELLVLGAAAIITEGVTRLLWWLLVLRLDARPDAAILLRRDDA